MMPRKENTAVAASFSQKTELHSGCDKPARLLNLVALRGGHACGHIFVRAAEGVCVTAAAENGRTLSGEEYNGENIVLYAEKGIAIERNWHHNGLPTGEYTDALLPLDTAVSFGETTVKDGKGIALFADFYIPEQTAGGIYEGFIEVRPDETIAFSEAVEWPEDIDEQRARQAKERAEEMVRRNRSAAEYQLNRLALQRAFARLRVKHHGDIK